MISIRFKKETLQIGRINRDKHRISSLPQDVTLSQTGCLSARLYFPTGKVRGRTKHPFSAMVIKETELHAPKIWSERVRRGEGGAKGGGEQ